jgi:hypothetical protein
LQCGNYKIDKKGGFKTTLIFILSRTTIDKILKEQKKVATSKVAAAKYLIKLGVLTKHGNVKKQ